MEMQVHRLDTHWSRILYYDLLTPDTGGGATAPVRRRKETFMTTRKSRPRGDRIIESSPLGSAMILLGIYIAMYLAVAEVVHVLTPPDALAAVAREQAVAAETAIGPGAPANPTGSNHAYTD
jgi:hypothetical protein